MASAEGKLARFAGSWRKKSKPPQAYPTTPYPKSEAEPQSETAEEDKPSRKKMMNFDIFRRKSSTLDVNPDKSSAEDLKKHPTEWNLSNLLKTTLPHATKDLVEENSSKDDNKGLSSSFHVCTVCQNSTAARKKT